MATHSHRVNGHNSKTTARVLHLMSRIQRKYGISFLLASHDVRVVKQATSIIHLLDGKIITPQGNA